jgi:dephospho-CoA kinase
MKGSDKPVKIALIGKIRSGKDSFANFLIDEYGFKRYAFGDGIGEVVKKYFPDEFIKGKPRKHYQSIGQHFRSLDAEVWIKYLEKQMNQSDDENIIITDLRQFNEWQRMKELGFIFIKVEAPEDIRQMRMKYAGDVWNPDDLSHSTEREIDFLQYDYLIKNDGTLSYLESRAKQLYRELKRKEG